MRELICLLVQARTARLGRARGASSDLILCSSTALISHSKLCPLLCPVLSSSSCPHPIGRKRLQSIALPVLIKQKTTIHAFCRQTTLAYLIYRHFYPSLLKKRPSLLSVYDALCLSEDLRKARKAMPRLQKSTHRRLNAVL